MPNVRKLARNPWAVIGLAAFGGWLVGSGVFALPFSLPSLPGHATATPGEPASPAGLPASSSAAATIAQSSAAMPASPAAPSDPFAGWDI